MPIKKIVKGLAVTALVLVLATAVALARWRTQQIARLESNSRVITTSQGPIEYALVGTGPAVLVLHGTLGGYDQLLPLVELLDTQSFQFVFISRPGYLRTPLSTGVSFETQADAYAALLDELGVEQAAVIAMSGGGPSALQFALRLPERCWGLVMLSANVDAEVGRTRTVNGGQGENIGPPPQLITNIMFSDFSSWMVAGMAKLLPRQLLAGLVGAEHVDSIMAETGKRERFDQFVESLALLSSRRPGTLNDGIQFMSYTGNPLSEITAPVLILHGLSDTSVPLAEPRYLHTEVPNSQLVEIEGGTHFMLLSHGDVVALHITNFLVSMMP